MFPTTTPSQCEPSNIPLVETETNGSRSPYGEKFNAKEIEKLLYTKDLLLNGEPTAYLPWHMNLTYNH